MTGEVAGYGLVRNLSEVPHGSRDAVAAAAQEVPLLRGVKNKSAENFGALPRRARRRAARHAAVDPRADIKTEGPYTDSARQRFRQRTH